MQTRLLYLWESLRTSYWFVPSLLSLASAGLAVGMVLIDRRIQQEPISTSVWWGYGGGPAGARAVMSTIAGSMITVAGVVFSITIVALSLASGQFGPRLLRNFIRDRSNQFVLGTFTGTYIYCLLVLRTIHGTDGSNFVPGAAVAVGILLALASLGVMIYFIHHVAITIQANQVIAAVSHEMRETIDRLWPEVLGASPEAATGDGKADLPDDFDRIAATVPSQGYGYIAAIEEETLLKVAHDRDLVLRLLQRPGNFVIEGSPLALVAPADTLDDELVQKLNRVFLFELQRTPYQDVEFTVDQLVEVAVRALSPGINDPFTAILCLDWLAEALGRLAGRSMPSPYHYDKEGKLRVVTRSVSFADVVDAAFNQIRQYGSTSAAVMIRMFDSLASVCHVAKRSDDRAALARHAHLVRQACDRDLPEPSDRMDAELRYARVMKILGEPTEEKEDQASDDPE